MRNIIFYCRPGFEKECALEVTDKAKKLHILGFVHLQHYSGYVVFECYRKHAENLLHQLFFDSLIFARQMFVSGSMLRDLSIRDRIKPIIMKLQNMIKKGGELRVEVADTNQGKNLLKFCRKFTVPLKATLQDIGILTVNKNIELPVIHVFFITSNCCYVGYSVTYNNSPFYMGIPRLKFPKDAPSRATLKLEEAFHLFTPTKIWNKDLKKKIYAVDLGACPGGWTYQLVKRNMWVYSVDNGRIDQRLIATGRVRWCKEDGFKFRPYQDNIDLLVCDITEKPEKITKLILKWLLQGWCKRTIFNLKLPMKKRYHEVLNNLMCIEKQLKKNKIFAKIQARQLYHDREEITIHIVLL